MKQTLHQLYLMSKFYLFDLPRTMKEQDCQGTPSQSR